MSLHSYYGKMRFQPRYLTHWGRVTHICVSKLTSITSDNGFSTGRHQAIIWTNAGILLIGPWGTNFSEILIAIQTCSFKKLLLKTSSAKWRLFCFGLNELKTSYQFIIVLPISMAWHGLWFTCAFYEARHHNWLELPSSETYLIRRQTMITLHQRNDKLITIRDDRLQMPD